MEPLENTRFGSSLRLHLSVKLYALCSQSRIQSHVHLCKCSVKALMWCHFNVALCHHWEGSQRGKQVILGTILPVSVKGLRPVIQVEGELNASHNHRLA